MDRRGSVHPPEKKWQSEADIHERIRQLTGEIRQLRQELRESVPQDLGSQKREAAERPRRRIASKKR